MNIAAPGVMMGAGGEFLSQATRYGRAPIIKFYI